jgi:hypothetical protein
MTIRQIYRAVITGVSLAFLSVPSAHALFIEGSTSGIFTNPVGPGTMVTTGVGTSSFTWGTPASSSGSSSSLDFTGTAFSTNTETFFDVGEISYFNGTIVGNTQADTVDLEITLNFTTPGGINEAFTYLLSLINTPNTGDPVASADFIAFPASLPSETFIHDGAVYSVGLEVGVVTGDGFSSQTTFSVLEDSSATATLRGIVTSEGVEQEVPAPATIALFSLGLAALGWCRRKL